MADMAAIFGEGGLLARHAPGFTPRPDQLRMAEAVAALLSCDREDGAPCTCLTVEAETGLGKTLAYLAPAVCSGKKVMVSTNTRNLQDQILHREIPLLKKLLAPNLYAVCVKGRQNYLCLYRWQQLVAAQADSLFKGGKDLERLSDWVECTQRGDRAELDWLSGSSPLWQQVCCQSHFCLGSDCPDSAGCFVAQVRRDAATADLLVVNHHLLFADLAVRRSGCGEVLPHCDYLLFDEAHHLENVATTCFGRSFSRLQSLELAADLERNARTTGLTGRQRDAVLSEVAALTAAVDRCTAAFPAQRGRFPLDWTAPALTAAAQEAEHLANVLDNTARHLCDLAASAGPLWEQYGERTAGLAGLLREILATACGANQPDQDANAALDIPRTGGLDSDSFTFWYERTERNVSMAATPVEVAGELQLSLYASARACLFTSATLTTGGDFAYFFSRMGLPADSPALRLSSPFDYGHRTLIYVPEPGFPEPASPQYPHQAQSRMEELIRLAKGRALLLFTSRQAMEAAHAALESRLPFPVFMQGEASRHTLLDRFSREIHSVLFAVASFWEGVDVPGESLSLVVMDKLPFEVPTDPVIKARMQRIEEQGGKPFFAFQMPRAIFTLRQGAGRLMRSAEDRGVIAVLDARLMTKGYGRHFVASLPPAPLTHDLARVAAFFSQKTSA